MKQKTTFINSREIALVALFASLLVLCSWISIPAPIPFSLQTFGVFLSLGILGGKLGTLSVGIYIIMGLVGLPVNAGFQGGITHLFSPTGGFLIGFLLSSLLFWLIEKVMRKSSITILLSMIIGLLTCYIAGVSWFMMIYSMNNKEASLSYALGLCVLPYIIPDIIKLILAYRLSLRLQKGLNPTKNKPTH